MKLLEDLGLKEVGTKGKRCRFGLYECPTCYAAFKCASTRITMGLVTACKVCNYKRRGIISIEKASMAFEGIARKVHGDKYNYSTSRYISDKIKVQIICPVHGIFHQTPNDHKAGHGCAACAIEDIAKANTIRAACSFITRALLVHGSTYDYSEVHYTKAIVSVDIVCRLHGCFKQTPHSHLKGQGCPSCALSGFDKNKPAMLYYLRVVYEDTLFYKIGITNLTVHKRFTRTDLEKIYIINTWDFLLGVEAYNKEQEILMQFKHFKYVGEPILSSGNTELFNIDILKLDKGY